MTSCATEHASMRPITYALQFRGVASEAGPGVLTARATAPGGSLVTVLGLDGLRGRFEPAPGEEALLESHIVLETDGSFELSGTIRFGSGHSLRLRTDGAGHLTPSLDRHLRHGSAVSKIHGGRGQFDGASGRITSNFFLSDTGELTDNQLGLVFISPED